jgi:hypothetical protein
MAKLENQETDKLIRDKTRSEFGVADIGLRYPSGTWDGRAENEARVVRMRRNEKQKDSLKRPKLAHT